MVPTTAEALAAATASLLAPGVVQWAVPSIREFQVASPAVADEPLLPLLVPSFQLAKSRKRSKVEATGPLPGTLTAVNWTVAEVMVDPGGMLPTSKRSRPRRVLPVPSVPASNQGCAPALAPGLPALMKVPSMAAKLTTAARPPCDPNTLARLKIDNNVRKRILMFVSPRSVALWMVVQAETSRPRSMAVPSLNPFACHSAGDAGDRPRAPAPPHQSHSLLFMNGYGHLGGEFIKNACLLFDPPGLVITFALVPRGRQRRDLWVS